MPPIGTELVLEAGQRWAARVRLGSSVLDACRFDAGYETFADGSITRFTGRPRGRDVALEPPDAPFDGSALLARLELIAARHGRRVDLRYTHVCAQRLVARANGDRHRKTVAAWAVLGSVATAGGRRIPVGWSGPGNGFNQLADPALLRRLDWLADAVNRAVPLRAGHPAVVLSPQAAALLVHESIGHFAEGAADGRTELGHRLGLRVASEELDVVDDPRARDGLARYDADDDAVEAFAPTEIVRGGVLVGQLHSCASAARAQTLPTANGRAALWAPPIPRMSNLICSTGAASEAALVDELRDGLFVHQLADGFGLGLSVEARVVLAERVAGGKRTGRFVTGGRLRERVGVLARVAGLGDRRELSPNGLCGKAGQLLFDVGTAAPAMRLTRLELAA